MSDFLAILKNIKFDPQLGFHMKNILTSQIDHLNFKDGETNHSTQSSVLHIAS
jgi:hypothetical protein